jgi:hypothetical protein
MIPAIHGRQCRTIQRMVIALLAAGVEKDVLAYLLHRGRDEVLFLGETRLF